MQERRCSDSLGIPGPLDVRMLKQNADVLRTSLLRLLAMFTKSTTRRATTTRRVGFISSPLAETVSSIPPKTPPKYGLFRCCPCRLPSSTSRRTIRTVGTSAPMSLSKIRAHQTTNTDSAARISRGHCGCRTRPGTSAIRDLRANYNIRV